MHPIHLKLYRDDIRAVRGVYQMLSLSELLTLVACAFALKCAYSVAATMTEVARNLDKIQMYLLDRNEYACKALDQLKAHQNSTPISQTSRRKKWPKIPSKCSHTPQGGATVVEGSMR